MKILRSDSAKPRASNRKTKPPTGTWYTAAKPAAAAEATNTGHGLWDAHQVRQTPSKQCAQLAWGNLFTQRHTHTHSHNLSEAVQGLS